MVPMVTVTWHLLKNLQWMQWDNYSLRYWSRLRSQFLTWKQTHTQKKQIKKLLFKSYIFPWNHKGLINGIIKWFVFDIDVQRLQNAADNQNPYHNFIMACEGFTVSHWIQTRAVRLYYMSVPYPEFKAPDLHKYYQHTTCLHLLIVGNCTGLEVTWDQ